MPPFQPGPYKLADVCGLVVEDGAIVIYARVPRAGMIVGPRSNGQIDGLPGRTTLFVTPGFYQLRNSRATTPARTADYCPLYAGPDVDRVQHAL